MDALKGRMCILVIAMFAIVAEGASLLSCEPNPCNNRGKCQTANNGSHYCECPSNRIGDLCQHENPCSPNQCQNGGTCSYAIVDGRGPEFKCTCRIGYTASLCEISLPNACDADPCKNRGTCSLLTIDSFKCICPAGFKGDTCDQVDHCASSPCLNQGECVANEDGYHCQCLPGFTGPTCTVDVDECAAADPCVRGKCLNQHGSYRCQCPEGYTGQKCESVYVPCEPSPCKNNARCVKYGEFKYHCECAPGYTGRHCEVNIDDCDNHLCKNGGQCQDGVLGYTCKCSKNYKGQFCQEDVDECMEASVCQNGGTCVNTNGGYHCICVNGWEGEHCQVNKDDCVGTVCYNGGTCHDRVASFYCECPIGKTGLLCHLDDACMSNPCQSGAICTTNPVDGAYLCSCPKGYTGVDCSNDINECDINGNPCEHGGTCVNTPGSYVCKCPKGWTGGWCEVNINECASNPCHNDATCLDDVGRFICVCMPGFTGLFCETDTRTPSAGGCSPNPCQHGGSCQKKGNGFECSCSAGFDGPTCQTAVDACETDPCQNGGTCSKKGSTYSCKCRPSFSGDRCQMKLDPCRGNHCDNGAVCTPSADFKDFSCTCPVGFTGAFCSEELNECASNPCQHGGVCFDKKNGFECSCQTGYSGLVCETNVDDCADRPCLNGGTCIDGINRYSCHCAAQFAGDRCQHTLDPCRGHHCDNGAVCTPSTNFRDYSCQCPAGFTGAFCDDDMDECAQSPCQNGAKCINSHGSYRCKCADGFTGQDCEVNHDECASNPCLNQGRCVDTVNGFRCECQPGFTGRQCASNVDECSSNPCHNGATCLDKVDGYVCQCRHGFSGTHCHLNDQDCQPGLCLNGGTCIDDVNNYRCECARGYSGKNCEKVVDLDLYNATDEHEWELCKRNDCAKKADNGICDPVCNYYSCNFDGEDCSAGLRPFENCTAPSYCAHVFRDGKCDDVCNNEACLFDGFDCQGDVDSCNPLYRSYCVKHFGDGNCDNGCNTSGCGFDGGDCEPKKEQRFDLTGDVVVILLIEAKTFVERANRFLMTVSKALRATVRIKTNDDARPMIYEWNSNDGLGALVAIKGDELKGLTTAESRTKREATTTMERLAGVLVVLSVDVTMCREQQRDDCFSDVLSVAAYLGAANAKQDLQELGMPMYSAYAQKLPGTGEGTGNPLMVAVISLLCMLALVLLALMVLANRKRKITAPVWVPPIGAESSKVSSVATGLNMVGKGDMCYQSAGGSNNYETGNFDYKRTRRHGPEGEEIPSALGHYLDYGQQPTDGNYDTDSVYYENTTLPIKMAGVKDDPRRWTREHYQATGRDAPVHAPPGNVNSRGPVNLTPVMVAAIHGQDMEQDQARVTKQLIDGGAVLSEQADCLDGDTALLLAVRHSRDATVRTILDHGGDPTEHNNRGDTALHHAVTINNANILRMLLETGRCEVDGANYDGLTPLILAAKVSHASVECAQLLLKHKADCFGNGGKSAADADGKTALHWAAVNNNVDLIDLLITHGANKDAQDNKDQTPLFLAAREGHMEAVERLVQAGASKEISDQMERWPREIAEENGRHAVANYLDKVPSPHLPQGVAVGPLNSGGTLPHSIRPQKPKPPRRSKSVREPKDKKPTPAKKPVMSPHEAAYAQQQHLMQQQRLVPGAVRSPPSVPNMESPYSTTPSPGNFLPRPNDCASLQAAAASSCMLSPYSEPHSGSSTSGLSPPQATLPTAKGYKSPPPYGTATAAGWQTSPESYHSPPEQNYYQQQRDMYQTSIVDNGYGYNADCYQQTQMPYCQQEQMQQTINPGQTVDAYHPANNGFYGYNVANGMY